MLGLIRLLLLLNLLSRQQWPNVSQSQHFTAADAGARIKHSYEKEKIHILKFSLCTGSHPKINSYIARECTAVGSSTRLP